MFSWLPCGSSDCAAPPWLGLLTGFWTDAVSGLPERESVARLLLIVAASSFVEDEGCVLVGLVVDLEARRVWTAIGVS